MLIDQALCDKGTSHHYQPPAQWASLRHDLRDRLLSGAFEVLTEPRHLRSSWSTDARTERHRPPSPTPRNWGFAWVEMEAAGLYAYAAARTAAVVCFAHITNTIATDGDDFEKGENSGVDAALALIRAAALTRAAALALT